jgi:hypothetical protein
MNPHATHPFVRHSALRTTFIGINHPLSTIDIPIVQFRGIKYASVPARFRQAKLFASYPATTDATRYGSAQYPIVALSGALLTPFSQTDMSSDKI